MPAKWLSSHFRRLASPVQLFVGHYTRFSPARPVDRLPKSRRSCNEYPAPATRNRPRISAPQISLHKNMCLAINRFPSVEVVRKSFASPSASVGKSTGRPRFQNRQCESTKFISHSLSSQFSGRSHLRKALLHSACADRRRIPCCHPGRSHAMDRGPECQLPRQREFSGGRPLTSEYQGIVTNLLGRIAAGHEPALSDLRRHTGTWLGSQIRRIVRDAWLVECQRR